MNFSIQFDRHLCGCAIEVDYEALDYLLTAEMQTAESIAPQNCP